MKKNVLRVISLLLVCGMLFAMSSCTQTVLIRFVDADGNDLDLGALTGGSTSTTTNTNTTPVADPTPSNDTSASTDTPASTDTKTSTASKDPSTVQEIADFYKAACARIKNNAEAGYTKKEWQSLDEINVGGSLINNALKSVAGSFMTTEADAEEQVNAKGSDDAKSRFPAFTLTDYSQIASATCTVNANGNYDIKIVMKDEDTPKKAGSVLGQVTNSLLYWEDIDDTLTNDSTVNKVLKSYSGIHVNYVGYTIECEISKDGKFVSLNHIGNVDIIIGEASLVVGSIKDKSGHLTNTCKYTAFNY